MLFYIFANSVESHKVLNLLSSLGADKILVQKCLVKFNAMVIQGFLAWETIADY